MPVPVTKYTCQFRCRMKAHSKKDRVAYHENLCWNNPSNKTCNSCKNAIVEYDDYDGAYRGCKLKAMSQFFESFNEKLRPRTSSKKVRPVYHCMYWNQCEDAGTAHYAEELGREIGNNETGTYHFPYYIPI